MHTHAHQLVAQLQEREVTLQQLAHLATQLEEAGQHASEGDAARDQLEKEVFSVRDRLQELEGHHLQVCMREDEWIRRAGYTATEKQQSVFFCCFLVSYGLWVGLEECFYELRLWCLIVVHAFSVCCFSQVTKEHEESKER